MRSALLLTVALLCFCAPSAQARPLGDETTPQLLSGPSPSVQFPAAPQKAAVDTTYILGGPNRWDGSFDSPDGQPDWHGWTHNDLTAGLDNHWHTSTYWAENLAGHGLGNHAMYCGQEEIPACSEADTIGGIGDNYFDDLTWTWSVADPSSPSVVHLTGIMTYDLTDETWDFLELFVQRADGEDMLDQWTGTGESTFNIDYTITIDPTDYTGPNADQVLIWWRVWSDGSYSDVDCLAAGHGACQIDDLSVYVDETLITFDDFEPGSDVNWYPRDFSGVGDFANLRNDLGDNDRCLTNTTYQVNFVDDGMVIPELDGTPCVDFCYDPGGWIVNNDGGLLANDTRDWFIENHVVSPPIAWIPGNEAAELAFDVYVDETLISSSAGIFYTWRVRSTDSDDPADLELAPWVNRNFIHYGNPEYRRHTEPISDLLVADRKWVQISLMVTELGWLWSWNGANGTPAPYFDNVALKAWPAVGPDISVRNLNLFADSFPESGILDPYNLAANSCRVDPAVYLHNATTPGDSLFAKIAPMRLGAEVIDFPRLNWVMQCNPTFDSVRWNTPNSQGVLRGSVPFGPSIVPGGSTRPDYWAVDLPDSQWFFPGDVLHYYITASDDFNGDILTTAWPADTTSVLDFSPGSLYPTEVTTRALPTVTQPLAGSFSHPSLLFIDSSEDNGSTEAWLEALQFNGYYQGTGFDHLKIIPNGFGVDGLASLEDLAHYQTIIYSSGDLLFYPIVETYPVLNDASLFLEWLDIGGKGALFAGSGLWSKIHNINDGSILAEQLGVQMVGNDIEELNGGWLDLQIHPLWHNVVLPINQQWNVYGGCPTIVPFDAIVSVGPFSSSVASFDPSGSTNGIYSAVVATGDMALDNRSIALPFDIWSIEGATPRANFLGYLLNWLSGDTSPAGDTPQITEVSASAYPNPFNPSTTITFALPRSMNVSLDIYDIHGLHVRSLLDESPFVSGNHGEVWDGRDSAGKGTSSGVYFYRLMAGEDERVGKLTLLK